MFTQAYCEERGGGALYACVIHTSAFSFTLFTGTTVLCNSIKDCLKLEISPNNYPGILKIHLGNIRAFCLLEMVGTLI